MNENEIDALALSRCSPTVPSIMSTLPTKDLYISDPSIAFLVISSLLYFVIGFVALIGNIFVIVKVYQERCLHKPTYYLIASLAVADLLTGTVALPSGAYGRVVQNVRTCSGETHLWFFMMAFYLHCVSVMHLIAIAIDRYICITRPLKYISVVTPKRIAGTIAFNWVMSCSFGLVPLYSRNDQTISHCSAIAYNIIMFYTSAILPLLCLLVLSLIYWIIFRVARRQVMRIAVVERAAHGGRKPIQIHTPQMKATKTTLLVLCVFAVCWLPISIKFLLEIHLKTTPSTMLYLRTAFEIIAFSNAALNPFVFVFRDRNFRGVLKHHQPKRIMVSL